MLTIAVAYSGITTTAGRQAFLTPLSYRNGIVDSSSVRTGTKADGKQTLKVPGEKSTASRAWSAGRGFGKE